MTYLLREILAYAAYFFKAKPQDQVRVAIFAQGRTGSTVLEDLLESSGCFHPHWELLSKVHSPFKRRFIWPLKYVIGLSKIDSHNFTFHVKIPHLTNIQKVDPNAFLKTLAQEGWKIIYLKRANKVNHVLSNFIAQSRGQYHKFDKKDENVQITVDCDLFCEKIHHRLDYDQLSEQALEGVEHLNLIYEEDLEREEYHQKTADKIFDYLSLERKKVSSIGMFPF